MSSTCSATPASRLPKSIPMWRAAAARAAPAPSAAASAARPRHRAARVPEPPSDDDLAAPYPRTWAAFAALPGGADRLRAVAALERRWLAVSQGPAPAGLLNQLHGPLPPVAQAHEYDVIVA